MTPDSRKQALKPCSSDAKGMPIKASLKSSTMVVMASFSCKPRHNLSRSSAWCVTVGRTWRSGTLAASFTRFLRKSMMTRTLRVPSGFSLTMHPSGAGATRDPR